MEKVLEEAKKVCVITRKNNNDKILILKSEFDEMIAFSKTVEKEIAVLKQQRPDVAKQLPDDVLSTYNRLLNGRSGRNPVCEIEDGICSGCHLKITPQTMNDVVRLQVAFCDNCQSFIYIP